VRVSPAGSPALTTVARPGVIRVRVHAHWPDKTLNVKQVAASALAHRLWRPNLASIHSAYLAQAHRNAVAHQAAILKTLGSPSVAAATAEGPCEWMHASDVPCGSCSVSGSKSMSQSWGHTQNDDQFERQECRALGAMAHTTTTGVRNCTQRTCDSLWDEGVHDMPHVIFNVTRETFHRQ
jgi:hypothetical protein